jgi:hypothetical protein
MDLANLNDRASLVYLRIGAWSARKLDRTATKHVTDDNGATADAARVNKHLLANADKQLKDIQKIGSEARRYVESCTLPWDDAGNRLLPNEATLETVTQLTGYEHQYNDAVAEFIDLYPDLREQAKLALGTLANDDDYPPAEAIRDKFSYRLSFNPVPVKFNDLRTGLSPEQASAISQHFEANAKRQVRDALTTAWKRLQENLMRYSDRLKIKDDGSGKMEVFRDSMVEGMRDTCSMLKAMNVFDDDDLERIRIEVEREICQFDADQLRGNQLLAMSVKSKADDILAKMREHLGL